eukprot:1021822-Rhodomonas_salina.2
MTDSASQNPQSFRVKVLESELRIREGRAQTSTQTSMSLLTLQQGYHALPLDTDTASKRVVSAEE